MVRIPIFPVTVLLALATGLTLLGIAATMTHPPIMVVSSLESVEVNGAADVVHQFYAAANEVLQTGDPTSLSGVVGSGYRETTTSAAPQTGIFGFTRFLTELRSACPDCRLQVEDLVMKTDGAAVRVSTHGLLQGTVQDIAVEGQALDWSALDVVKIAEGQVVERWSQGEVLSLVEPLFAEMSVEVPIGTSIVQMSRLVLPVGSHSPPEMVPGPVLLMVEAGALTVQEKSGHGPGSVPQVEDITLAGQGSDTVPIDVVLGSGEWLVISSGVRVMISNDGPSPAVALIFGLAPDPTPANDDVAVH